ncbi:hypothetical protein ACWEKT_26740 [Nocardia takedensis]
MTPEQVAGLDIDRFKAVRYGQEVGYDPATRGKYYQVPGQDPIAVPYASPERRLADMSTRVERGLPLQKITTWQLLDIANTAAADEDANTRTKDAPHRNTIKDRDHGRGRGLGRDR